MRTKQGPHQFAADSPLEGTGFEPSVPRGKGRTLRVSVLFHSDFSVGGEPTSGDIERLVVSRGTDGSNPVPSSVESSANCLPRANAARRRCRECRYAERATRKHPDTSPAAPGTQRDRDEAKYTERDHDNINPQDPLRRCRCRGMGVISWRVRSVRVGFRIRHYAGADLQMVPPSTWRLKAQPERPQIPRHGACPWNPARDAAGDAKQRVSNELGPPGPWRWALRSPSA
jgi:hypothetical protein